MRSLTTPGSKPESAEATTDWFPERIAGTPSKAADGQWPSLPEQRKTRCSKESHHVPVLRRLAVTYDSTPHGMISEEQDTTNSQQRQRSIFRGELRFLFGWLKMITNQAYSANYGSNLAPVIRVSDLEHLASSIAPEMLCEA